MSLSVGDQVEIVAMEPSFWSWEKEVQHIEATNTQVVAMEPSFWSWEKTPQFLHCRLGVPVAMEPSFWSWEKLAAFGAEAAEDESQWSPAFRAGKRWYPY